MQVWLRHQEFLNLYLMDLEYCVAKSLDKIGGWLEEEDSVTALRAT